MQGDALEMHSRRVLERWRQRRESPAGRAAPAAAAMPVGVPLMIVQEVIGGDSLYGPHLRVVPVALEGTPPAVRALGGPVVRCFPMPGRVVAEYAAGEMVKVYWASGASLAEKVV